MQVTHIMETQIAKYSLRENNITGDYYHILWLSSLHVFKKKINQKGVRNDTFRQHDSLKGNANLIQFIVHSNEHVRP